MLKKYTTGLARRVERYLDRQIVDTLQAEATAKALDRFYSEAGDLDTLKQVLSSQRFRKAIQPVERRPRVGSRILVYAPHQDDETLGAGATLLMCARQDCPIQVVYVTDGVRRKLLTDTKHQELCQMRRQEARAVWSLIDGHEPIFWNLPCNAIPVTEAAGRDMRGQIEAFSPDVIFVPFFLEGPADHRAITTLLHQANAVSALPEDLEIWCYQITGMLAPNVVVDITDFVDQKYRINLLWKSQNRTFNYAHMAKGLNAYNSIFLRREVTDTPRSASAELFFVENLKRYLGLTAALLGGASTAGKTLQQ